MDLVRERRVPLGDKLWAELTARAAQHGLSAPEAVESAILQWLSQDFEGRCASCGSKICHPTSEHHENWCSELQETAVHLYEKARETSAAARELRRRAEQAREESCRLREIRDDTRGALAIPPRPQVAAREIPQMLRQVLLRDLRSVV